jgi:SPP1 gp7 family putative phage head morphogenesis protein
MATTPPEEGGANEALFAALIRHQIMMLRVSADLRRRIQRLLDETEADIADKIRSRLLGNTGLETQADVRRMEALLRSIRNIRTRAWSQVTDEWVQEAMAIAEAEPRFVSAIMTTVSPVVLDLVLPPVEQLRALVESNPFEGQTLREWASTIAQADLRRIEGQIRAGVIAGEGSAAIARRVVGSARLRGTDGVTQITRREAESITRTAVNHISNAARREFIIANADLFDKEQFVATLDARTTPVCRSYDGERFDVGKGPIPPLHFNCRSLRVPVLDGDALGSRPFVAATRAQVLREYAEQNGLKVPKTRDGLPYGHKTAFDQFARRRVRELTGRVPGRTTYQEWLSTQSAAFQDDVLGPTRAALFRRGGLTLDKFVNRRGDELTLSQLATLHEDAFRAAGLDPKGFRD